MSELPSFDDPTPEILFKKEREANSPHVRSEGKTDEKYQCEFPGCKESAKSKAGLASHFRTKHKASVNDALNSDVIVMYVKATVQNSALYHKDMDVWIAPLSFKVPDGYRIYDIDRRLVSMMGDMRSYNTHRVTLVREGVMLNE